MSESKIYEVGVDSCDDCECTIWIKTSRKISITKNAMATGIYIKEVNPPIHWLVPGKEIPGIDFIIE